MVSRWIVNGVSPFKWKSIGLRFAEPKRSFGKYNPWVSLATIQPRCEWSAESSAFLKSWNTVIISDFAWTEMQNIFLENQRYSINQFWYISSSFRMKMKRKQLVSHRWDPHCCDEEVGCDFMLGDVLNVVVCIANIFAIIFEWVCKNCK